MITESILLADVDHYPGSLSLLVILFFRSILETYQFHSTRICATMLSQTSCFVLHGQR